ncbi:MAG: 50S ribosomal protein L9 [Phycisphaerales bacterium]
MPKNIKLLLTENVEALGIVGDVVTVRTGYARNFLLPREYATTPTEDAIKAVAAKRAEAERQLAELRRQREALVKKLEGVQVTLVRSCNDLGHLYASVTQQEIAAALGEAGYKGIRPRDVRLNTVVKRIDTYDVPIKFEADLEASIKLWVVADRKLDLDKIEEAQSQPQPATAPAADAAAAAPDAGAVPTHDKADRKSRRESGKADAKPDTTAGGDGEPRAAKPEPKDKGARAEGKPSGKSEGKGEKAEGKPRGEGKGAKRDGKADGKPAEAEAPKADKSGWGKKPDMPSFVPMAPRDRRKRR